MAMTAMRTRDPMKPFRAADTASGYYSQPVQETIEWHWSILPGHAREFILDTPDGFLGLEALVDFWSQPHNAKYARGDLANKLWRASWFLSFNYLRQSRLRESRALLINGAFLHQCQISTIESIKNLCFSTIDELKYFVAGVAAAQTAKGIKAHIEHYVTNGKLASDKPTFVGHISDNWDESRKGGHRKPRRKSLENEEKTQLVFIDESDGDKNYRLDVGSSTALKASFDRYAESRGVSLRSLRFTHAGKTLFLSSAGKKTPGELGMTGGDNNIIKVTDTTSPPPTELKEASKGKQKTSRRKSKGQGKKKKGKKVAPAKVGKTEEELKNEHSMRLNKLHEELHPRLKQIRQRLNNLVIERSQPKARPRRRKSKDEAASRPMVDNTCSQATGGKAGRSRFVVQVGEVENLYKTSKPSAPGSHAPRLRFALDLHGCTRKEASARLDENHQVWVDAAMRGSYPFVAEVSIVCGCGGQSLSETVQEWIRSKENVSNAPKRL